MKKEDTTSLPSVAPWPFYAEDEIQAVTEVLRTGKVNYWTGQEARLFEQEYASAAGTKHAIALSNGTLALELALYGLGIGPGDEVITTSRTFIASASCAVMRGAVPVCVDVDLESGNITAETIRPFITPRTKAIVAVHLAGWPCEMDEIMTLAREYGLKVIEDCAQANGATYKGQPIGGIGDVGCFSFCQDKIITTGGEGGMMTLNDTEMWSQCWSFKDHGKNWDAVYNRAHAPGYRWLHESFGTNWRMTELQAVLGRLQLKKLPEWTQVRATNAARLTHILSSFEEILRIPSPPTHIGHAWYKFYAYVRPERLANGWTRDRIMQEISARGIPCFSGSCSEIYLEKAFTEAALGPGRPLPGAKELGETSLMFLVHPTLTVDDHRRTESVLSEVFRKAVS